MTSNSWTDRMNKAQEKIAEAVCDEGLEPQEMKLVFEHMIRKVASYETMLRSAKDCLYD